MKKMAIVALGTLALGSTLFANANTGCGLGSVFIKDQNSTIMQVFAASTNGTSGNQTFGISSGTLNCEKPKSFVSNDKLNRFVADNMDELAMDISAGKGENLDTLASLLNVKNKEAFNAKLKVNFSNIYSSNNVNSAQVINKIAKYI